MTYSVVLYTNAVAMTFSVTARKTIGARLDEVNAQQASSGFTVTSIATSLTELAAVGQKRAVEARQRTAGYRKVPRPQLR